MANLDPMNSGASANDPAADTLWDYSRATKNNLEKINDEVKQKPFQGGFSNMQVFDTPGNFTFAVPANVSKICIRMVGGGGGGGGYCEKIILVTSGAAVNIAVGAGGAGATSANANPLVRGDTGGPSTVTLTDAGGNAINMQALGGQGGAHLEFGVGGAASGGDINIPGNGGYGPTTSTTIKFNCYGGSSYLGTNSDALTSQSASPGRSYGSGGAATNIAITGNFTVGGDAAPGVVIIEW